MGDRKLHKNVWMTSLKCSYLMIIIYIKVHFKCFFPWLQAITKQTSEEIH